MDFLLEKDDFKDLVFRFYPRQSYMHSFDGDPPKTFDDVYKIYYAWGVIWKYGENGEFNHRVFYMPCDECSALGYLSNAIRECIETKEDQTVFTSGLPGSDWYIDVINKYLEFKVFDNLECSGVIFTLPFDQALEFADFLDKVNQHMLENGEPI